MKKLFLFILINVLVLAEGIELKFSTGVLNGVAHEFVYKDSEGTKLSELIWNLEGVNLFGIGASYTTAKGKINGDLKVNFETGTSTMDDYDWMMNTSDWTDWSHSPTDIKSVYKFDINYEYEFYRNNFSLNFLTGYKLDYFDWVAIGGTYIYSSENTVDRAHTGTFADEPGISYTQTFSAPYFGFSSLWETDLLSFSTKAILSPFVYATDKDIHHQRENGGMVFEGVFSSGTYLELGLEADMRLSDNLSLELLYNYSNYMVNTGYYTGYYIGTGGKFSGEDGTVGLDNVTSTISLSVTYKF